MIVKKIYLKGFRNEFNRPVDLTQGAMPETYRLMDPLVGAKGKLSLDVKKTSFLPT
jgi:hypothetical protein